MAEIKFNEMEIQNILNKGVFTEEEINEAMAREDLNSRTTTKTMKLQMNNLKDRLLAIYLEDKSFTEIVWRSIEIYKQHFDANVLLQEKLEKMKKVNSNSSLLPTVVSHSKEEPIQEQENEVDDEEFMNV